MALVKYFDVRFFLDLGWELHITNKGYDELQLARYPAYPQHWASTWVRLNLKLTYQNERGVKKVDFKILT